MDLYCLQIKQFDELDGVQIDETLSWDFHANSVATKCRNVLWTIYPLMNVLSIDSKIIIVNGLIISLINFSAIAWLYPSTHKTMERILRQCARYIFGLTRYDSVKLRMSEILKWLFPKYLHQYEVLKLCFLSYRGRVPDYFNDYLTINVSEHIQTRSRCYPDNPYTTNSMYGKLAIKYIASKEWNDFLLNQPDFDMNMSYFRFKTVIRDTLLSMQTNEFILSDTQHSNCDFSCIESAISDILM
jgi:hypothetical protein